MNQYWARNCVASHNQLGSGKTNHFLRKKTIVRASILTVKLLIVSCLEISRHPRIENAYTPHTDDKQISSTHFYNESHYDENKNGKRLKEMIEMKEIKKRKRIKIKINSKINGRVI